MRIFVLLSLILSSVFGEAPAPYSPSGWRPQGEPFNLPSRQQLSQQYGAPQVNQQSNTVPYSPARQLDQQYGAPQINQQSNTVPHSSARQQIDQQYGAPQVNQQSNIVPYSPARQLDQQYGAPQVNQQSNTVPHSSARQQLDQQYGAPQVNQQSNTVPYSPARQLDQQYGAPQVNQQSNTVPHSSARQQLDQQYGAPQVNQQSNTVPYSSARQLNQQYGAPQLSNQYGAALSADSLNSQYLPSAQPARNFNNPVPNSQYIPQNFVNNAPNRNQQQFSNNFDSSNLINQKQSGKLISQISTNAFGASNQNFQRQNPQNFNQKPLRNREEINVSDEINQDQLNDQSENLNEEDFTAEPEPEYGAPTTTKRSIKAPRKPERTTIKPRTEEPDRDGDSDQPNIAISTAVSGASTSGQYYILQPDGRLQRVVYMTSPDQQDKKNAAVIANLMYEIVEPLKGPIYQYVGSELVRIN